MKTMALLASTIMLFCAHEGAAQWTRTAGPEGGRVDRMLTTPTSILLALEGGAIYRSTDHGTTWTSTVDALSNVSDEYSGFVLSGSTVFASTYTAGVFRSTNDGLTWTPSSNGLIGAGMYTSALVSMGDTLVITTYGGGIHRSTNGGALWVKTNTGMPADTSFNALHLSGKTLFAGSDEGAGVFASTDAGLTWFRASDGLNGDGRNVLCFASSGAAVIAGTRLGAFRSTDNGVHWTLCSSGMTNINVSTLYTWGTDVYAGTYGSGVYRSTNAGVDWSPTTGTVPNQNIRALTAAGSDLFAGTYGPGVVYKSSNLGVTWTTTGKGITCNGVPVMTVHAGKILGAPFSGLVFSTNQGAAWIPGDSAVAVNTVYALLSRTSDVWAGTAGAGAYRSTNGASTWFAASTGLDGNAQRVWSLAADGATMYAGTMSGVFRSTNNGGQWTQATQGIPDSVIRKMIAHNGTVYAGTFKSLYRSTNSGQNWSASTTGLPQIFLPEAFAVVDSFVFVGISSGVYRTSNRGESWTQMSSGIPSSPDIRSLVSYQLPLPEAKLLFAGLGHGGVYMSSDRGANWAYAGTGLAAGMNILSLAADQGYLYAGTYAHGVWKRAVGEMLVSVDDAGVSPEEFALEQNYPNPFNPSTAIAFSVGGIRDHGSGASHVKLAVYDLLGREVAVIVDEWKAPGRHVATFDGSALASGVYVYRLTLRGSDSPPADVKDMRRAGASPEDSRSRAGTYVASRRMVLAR